MSEKETSETPSNLCLQLFQSMGVKEISMQDIDIAHRLPTRHASSLPSPVVCKFLRRLTKEKVMKARNHLSKITASHLGFDERVSLSRLKIYDHLTPRIQGLLAEARKIQQSKGYQFCWAKHGSVFLRMTESSSIIKIQSQDQLQSLLAER